MARTPMYQLIVADIRGSIAGGQLKPGDRLPSITQLSAQYECSETVVKTALAVLRAMDLIEGQQGVANFVK